MLNIGDTMEEFKRLIETIYNGEEYSIGDSREAERLRGIVEDYLGGHVRFIEIPVYSWVNKYLKIDGVEGGYSVAPYILSAEVDDAKLFEIKEDPSSPDAWVKHGVREGVAVIREPEDPDDLKASALLAAEAGFSGILVFSDKLRKIVTTGTWNYSFNVGAPTPIPVIYVEKPRITRDRVSLYVESEVKASKGYILEWDSSGSDNVILIGAHYDRWFSGFQDNILGVIQAMVLAKRLSELSKRVKLVLFTAEEYGAPGYAGWYWSWGSRFYSQQIYRSRIEDSINLYVNFDVAGNRNLMVSGTRSYIYTIKDYINERCCECPECDSMQLAMIGVPTLSFHSLWSQETLNIYHTREDTPENADLRYAAKAVEIAYKAILNTPQWEYVGYELTRLSRELPLEGRRLIYKLASIASRVGWEKLYRELAVRTLRPVHYGSYRYDSVRLEALMLPEISILPRLLDDVRRGDPPHEVWISGEEKLIYAIKAKNGEICGVNCIIDQARHNIRALDDVIDEVYIKLVK